jgi:glycosyltransferase involved in cell wall biosynthesis
MHTDNSDQPLVSIHLGCYNHSKYVVDALESIKAQTYKNYQVYIWDDCSQDNSREVIKEWIEKNHFQCTFVANPKNLGICRCLNNALAAAKGKYIAGFSADDVWLPDKIEKQVEFFQTLPESVGVVYSDMYLINEQGEILPNTTKFDRSKYFHPKEPEGWVFKDLLKYNFVPAGDAMCRSSVFKNVGNYDENLRHEDTDMWLRIADRYEFRHLPEILSKYRVLSNSLNVKMRSVMPQEYEKIFLKWIYAPLQSDSKNMLFDIYSNNALNLYKEGFPEASSALNRAYQLKKGSYIYCASLAAKLGVPYNTFHYVYMSATKIFHFFKMVACLK